MGHGIEQADYEICQIDISYIESTESQDSDNALASATAEFSDSAFENLPSQKLGATMEKLSYATLP